MSSRSDPEPDSEVQQLRARVAQLQQQIARLQQTDRETEQQLDESENLLQSLVENVPDLIVLLDRNCKIHYINRIEPGYTRDQVLGATCYDLVVPEHREIVVEAVRKVFDTQQPADYRVRDVVRHHWYQARVTPLRGGGQSQFAVAICTDIQEQREREDDLIASRSRLEMLVEQIPAILWTTDCDLRLTSATGAGLKAMRLVNKEVVGRTLPEFFRTDDPDFKPVSATRDALAGKSVNFTQHWENNWYQSHVEPLHNAEGRLLGTIGVAFDITQQKSSDEAYRKTLEIFRILGQNIPGVVYLCENDERYRMRYLSASVADLLGIPFRQFIDDRVSFVELYHPEDAERIRGDVDAALARREPFHLEYRLRHADGRWIWVEEHGQGVFDDGELRFLEGTIFDITEKRMAEEVLRRSNEELEGLVAKRTRELEAANRILQQDLLKLEKLSRQLRESEDQLRRDRRLLRRMLVLHERDRQLIAYEIHDGIVQDMTAASYQLQAAAKQFPEECTEAQRKLSVGTDLLRGSIDEARRLINGLRPAVLEEEGVISAVEQLVHLLRKRNALKIELLHDVQFNRLAPALEMAIYRIIQEGLNNIVQHSQSPKARVRIVQQREQLKISIRDWGIGFDFNNVKKKRYGLLGVRERAKLLGGEATIESRPGKGSRIRVILPLIDMLLPEQWQGDTDDDSSVD